MKPDQIIALISYRMKRAGECLQAALPKEARRFVDAIDEHIQQE